MPLTRIIVMANGTNENNLATAYDYLKIFSEQHRNHNSTSEMKAHRTEAHFHFDFNLKYQ